MVEKLAAAGAIILGKTDMDELPMGSDDGNVLLWPNAEPCQPRLCARWLQRRLGGGCGCREAVYALGSDTGGSIRQPAAFCGIVGLKPTYGAVSRYGLIAFASSLDQIGPLTHDVRDAALVMNAIAGYDHRDSTSANVAHEDYTRLLGKSIEGLKIGVPQEYLGEGVQPAIRESIARVRALLEAQGAICEDCSLPTTNYAIPAYY